MITAGAEKLNLRFAEIEHSMTSPISRDYRGTTEKSPA